MSGCECNICLSAGVSSQIVGPACPLGYPRETPDGWNPEPAGPLTPYPPQTQEDCPSGKGVAGTDKGPADSVLDKVWSDRCADLTRAVDRLDAVSSQDALIFIMHY